MPAKKKTESKPINMDLLTKKMNQIGQELDTLQLDVKDMATELLKIIKEHNEKQPLLRRIKDRLGL